MERTFADRREAGQVLAGLLGDYAGRPDVVVLGLARGGVPVAYEVARGLGAPLDVLVVRKLGVPGHEELAMGAIASGGTLVVNERVRAVTGLGDETLERVRAAEAAELDRREHAYRAGRPHAPLAGTVAVLVDDGLATGATMIAAVRALRENPGGPDRIVVAVPVGSTEACEQLRAYADDVVCVSRPEAFFAVGQAYGDFTQTSDDEVRDLLSRRPPPAAGPAEAAAR